MSETCAIPKCERTSRALCDCCQQTLCLQHLSEHNASLVSQLNLLTDKINALADRLHRLNLHETARDCRERLEEWRQDGHRKIDRFFEQKSEEYDRLITTKIDEEREKVLHIQTKLAKLIREQEATRQDIDTLTSTIDDLKKEMNKIEGSHFRIDTCPLSINDKMVQFKEVHELEFDLSSLLSVHKSIICPLGTWDVLPSNDRLLLVHQAPNLCFLNIQLQIIKQVIWPHEGVDNMCWSSMLNRLIVILTDDIFFVDENTMSVERMQITEKQQWFHCTCFRDQLFLSTNAWGSSIVQMELPPSIAIIKTWKTPKTCTKKEFIDDIVYNNGTLDVVYNKDIAFHRCSLNHNGWLVDDYNTERLIHITTDGVMKQTITYKVTPFRITLFTPDMIVVSTKSNINFHKI